MTESLGEQQGGVESAVLQCDTQISFSGRSWHSPRTLELSRAATAVQTQAGPLQAGQAVQAQKGAASWR